PDGAEVRLVGRLGSGVAVRDGRLVVPEGVEVPLSVSTAQVPFAGHDDPRRLLLGAGAQVQAVRLEAPEPPRVHTAADGPGVRPDGVNLAVGFLAWQGLNHEDAWVLSASAADRLVCVEEVTQYVCVGVAELSPEVLVAEGTSV